MNFKEYFTAKVVRNKTIGLTLLFIMTVFIIQSCETDIPETDTTPPTFSFHITGDDFDHTFTQDDDFDTFELYLKNNTNYHFTFVAADQGGLRIMEWNIEPKIVFELITPIDEPWEIVPNVFSENMWIRWTDTTPANAQNGQLLVGDFRLPVTIQNNESYTLIFGFYAGDFGGLSGTSNTVNKQLKIVITNQNTGIVDRLI